MNEARLKMELHKVEREVKTHGTAYTFFREKKDEYGENTEEQAEMIVTIRGLFHISKEYVTETTQDGTKTHSKGSPKLLVAYVETKNIQNGDYLEINKNKYKVVDKNNIQEYSIVVDISLEMVIDDRN